MRSLHEVRSAAARQVLLALLGLGGCSFSPARVTRELALVPGVVATNLPMLLEERTPRSDDGKVGVVYSIVLENVGAEGATVRLGAASVRIDELTRPMRCSAGGRDQDFLLEPRARWRVDCDLDITDARPRLHARGDVKAVLRIPVSVAGDEHLVAFTYLLRAEDGS